MNDIIFEMTDEGDVLFMHADMREALRSLPDNSVDSVVTDPPYGLEFMGKAWDSFGGARNEGSRGGTGTKGILPGYGRGGTSQDRYEFRRRSATGFQRFCAEWAGEVFRVLKPGGHLAAFGGTRTFARMSVAIEDAGFEIRDTLMWCYSTGFPKSHDVSKGIDKAAGAEREIVGPRPNVHSRGNHKLHEGWKRPWQDDPDAVERSMSLTAPATDAAKEWQGFGTSLKPAVEPVVLARKPLSEKTVAANVLRWRTGAINIDGCRVPATDKTPAPVGEYGGSRIGPTGHKGTRDGSSDHLGRWPANLVTDGSDEVIAMFPVSSVTGNRSKGSREAEVQGTNWLPTNHVSKEYPGESGSAARFFYQAKASRADRAGSSHPTVKPISLMRWLTRLITPPGGLVLDPFAGSGTTGAAAIAEGMRCLLIEREAEYADDIRRRLAISDIGLI